MTEKDETGRAETPLDAFRMLWKPSDAGFLDELTSPQRAVLTVLIVHANGGVAWPSHKTISIATGFARSTVIQALGELVTMGLITREPDPPNPTRYTVQGPDRPGGGPSRRKTDTVQEVDSDRPGPGQELLIELSKELDTSKSAEPIADLWQVWVDELGGKPPHPKLTDTRRRKLEALYSEHLKDDPDPTARFRAICRAVLESDHHMSVRAYQMPESLFKNPERRERWYLEGGEARASEDGQRWADLTNGGEDA